MAANYKIPLVVNKRVRFFDGQFLQDQDFVDEQKYNVGWQNQHHRSLHVAGVAEGLTMYKANNATQLQVNKGIAIDADGRQIILIKRSGIIDLPLGNSWLYIVYHQVPDDLPSTSQGVEEETRWRDEPYIFTHVGDGPLGIDDTYQGPDWNGYLETADGPPPPVLLAKITVANDGTITTDESVRRYSGLRLPGPGTAAPTLRTDTSGNVGLWLVNNNDEIERLTVTPEGRLGLGTTAPDAALEINNTLTATSTAKTLVGLKISPTYDSNGKTDVKQYGLLVESGFVGIGTPNPATNLEVRGVSRAGTSAGNYTEISHGGSHGYVNKVGTGRLDFRHNGTNKMVLTPTGDLGIGMDLPVDPKIPNAKVDITGKSNTAGQISLQLRSGNTSSNFNSNQITLGYNDTAEYRHAVKTRHNSSAQFGNAIDFYVWKRLNDKDTDEKGDIGTLHTMTLDGGRVGIGNTDPGIKLDVSGDARFLRGDKEIVFSSGNFSNGQSTDLFFNKGNVGFNQSEFILYNSNDNTAPDRYFQLQFSEDTGGLTIRKGGNVGVGTTAPEEKLEIAGAIRATDGLYMDKKSTEPQGAAGWHRIIEGANRGSRNSGIFEIRWAASGRHGHVRFIVSANYGFDNGAQLTILDQSSFSGRIVTKIRLLMNNTYDKHYVEFYFDGNKNGDHLVPFNIYQLSGFGWSLVEPEAGSIPADYTAHEIPANVMFAAKSGANDSSLFVVNNGAYVGIGTADPVHRLDVNGRLHVNNGVIQRGGEAITNTSDLGLYSRHDGSWIRIVTNNAPIKFFTDDGIGSDSSLEIQANGRLGYKTKNFFTKTGTVAHDDTIPVPSGTTKSDWNVFISPYGAGVDEGSSNQDNALLRIECRVDDDWKVVCRSLYRYSTGDDGKWHSHTANYILVPK